MPKTPVLVYPADLYLYDQNTVPFRGTGTPGSTVTLSYNGTNQTTIVGLDGIWRFSNVPVKEGVNSYTLQAEYHIQRTETVVYSFENRLHLAISLTNSVSTPMTAEPAPITGPIVWQSYADFVANHPEFSTTCAPIVEFLTSIQPNGEIDPHDAIVAVALDIDIALLAVPGVQLVAGALEPGLLLVRMERLAERDEGVWLVRTQREDKALLLKVKGSSAKKLDKFQVDIIEKGLRGERNLANLLENKLDNKVTRLPYKQTGGNHGPDYVGIRQNNDTVIAESKTTASTGKIGISDFATTVNRESQTQYNKPWIDNWILELKASGQGELMDRVVAAKNNGTLKIISAITRDSNKVGGVTDEALQMFHEFYELDSAGNLLQRVK